MTAIELLKALHASGTGVQKIEQARMACRHVGKVLGKMSGSQLLPIMARIWPEGTLAKAFRLVNGQPADLPPKERPSGPDDWDAWASDDAEAAELLKRDGLPQPVSDEDERIQVTVPDELPPGVHESQDDDRLKQPGISRRGVARPRKINPAEAALAASGTLPEPPE